MTTATAGKYHGRLVDADAGLVRRDIFVDEAIYREELERVFGRSWLFVGHESQVPNKGDFFTSRMGEESVILCRDQKGAIRVLHNTCRHRGMKLCRYDQGNAKDFVCSYHGWCFALDGTLAAVPKFRESYQERLDLTQWGLAQPAQLFNYKGAIWANWDGSAPGFLDYLGGFRIYLDLALEAWDGDGETEVLGGIQKWQLPCNWKFAAENNSGDAYHGPISHVSVNMAGTRTGLTGGKRRDETERDISRYMQVCFPELGHQGGFYVLPRGIATPTSYQEAPVVAEYLRDCAARRHERKGALGRLLGAPGEVFPNLGYIPRQPRTLAVWNPNGPHQTEVWRWYLVDKKAPQEVKDYLCDFFVRYAGPGGMTEQDDMENWNYAHAASRSPVARRYAYNYAQGIGRGVRDLQYDGLVLPGIVVDLDTHAQSSEQNMRSFYGRWADYMEAESWSELARAAAPATR